MRLSHESYRFAQLLFGMWVAAAMGIMWAFGVVSNELKEVYQLDQSTMTWITTAGSAFGMFGLPAGILFDFFGPPGALLVGGMVTGAGSLLLSCSLFFANDLVGTEPKIVCSNLTLTNKHHSSILGPLTPSSESSSLVSLPTTSSPVDEPSSNKGPIALIFIGYILLLHGTTYLDVGGIMATLFSFPLDGSDVVMLCRTLTGLGGTFFVYLFNGFFVQALSSSTTSTPECGGQGNTTRTVLSPLLANSTKTYGRYMFACSGIIIGISLLAAFVIRFPLYHQSGWSQWSTKRRQNSETQPLLTDDNNRLGESRLLLPLQQVQKEEEQKQFYGNVRASQRRMLAAFIFLGCFFTLFTVISFLKATKDSLPQSVGDLLFSPEGNRGVSITSIILIVAVLPIMAFPIVSMQKEDDWANAISGWYQRFGYWLDHVGKNKSVVAATTQKSTERERESQVEEEGKSSETGCNQVAINEAGEVSVCDGKKVTDTSSSTLPTSNPAQHKMSCRYTTTFKQSIKTLPILWCLMAFACCSWGAGATIINNSAQILRAVNDNVFDDELNNLMVSVVGLATALGRIFVGVVGRYYATQPRHSSAIILPVGPATMVLGAALIITLPARVSYLGIAATAFGYGLSWASTMLLVREAFVNDIGKVYYMCSTTAVISVIAFNRGLFGSIFDHYGAEQGVLPNCRGVICIQTTMLVAIGLLALGTCFSFAAYLQWRRRLLKVE